jgi:hypothetical protein
MNKRYIYAGFTGGLMFFATYVLLDINVFISLLISIATFGASILIFKEKDIKLYDENIISTYYTKASQLFGIAKTINNEELVSIVQDICTYTDRIIKAIRERPKKVAQVYSFFDYYLNFSIKILDQYNDLTIYHTKSSELQKDADTLLFNMKRINKAFEQQFDNMYHSSKLDMDSEIKSFEKLIKANKIEVDKKEVK